MQKLLYAFLTHFTYPALALVLIFASVGVPIPEDIPLIFSGYLCNPYYSPIKNLPAEIDTDNDGVPDRQIPPKKVPDLYIMIAAGMVGVLVGDILAFSIGRKGIDSNNMLARHIRKVMHSKRREKVEAHFAKHGNLTVFVGRFMPGFRAIVFAFAGMSKMSFLRFMLIDGIAAAISVPFFVWVGYYFADRIDAVWKNLERFKHIAMPVIVGVIVAAALIFYLRRRRAVQSPATTPENL